MSKPRKPKPPADLATAREQLDDARSRLAHLEAADRGNRAEIRRLQAEHGRALEFSDSMAAALRALPAVPRPPALKVSAGRSEVAMVAALGDWHIGERTVAAETDGFGSYDLATARRRIGTFCDRVQGWLDIMRRGYRIDRAHALILGDMIHGDIHPEEYLPTNELTVPEQVAESGRLLAVTLSRLAAEVKTLTVDMIGADNHGRRTKKPASKEAARNSYNFLVYEIAKTIRRAQGDRIEFRYHLPLKAELQIEGQTVLIEHGHSSKAWMGIPYYGIERAQGREARKRLPAGRAFRLHVMGHWHTPAELPGLILNGSLCGANEYDSLAGRFAEPSQTTFLYHHTHGPFARIAWKLN